MAGGRAATGDAGDVEGADGEEDDDGRRTSGSCAGSGPRTARSGSGPATCVPATSWSCPPPRRLRPVGMGPGRDVPGDRSRRQGVVSRVGWEVRRVPSRMVRTRGPARARDRARPARARVVGRRGGRGAAAGRSAGRGRPRDRLDAHTGRVAGRVRPTPRPWGSPPRTSSWPHVARRREGPPALADDGPGRGLVAGRRSPLAKGVDRGAGARRRRSAWRACPPAGGTRPRACAAWRRAAPSPGAADPDLVRWLVATHHGYARPWWPVVEGAPPDPGLAGPMVRLGRRLGWWRVAWLEAVLRCADRAVSREEARADA